MKLKNTVFMTVPIFFDYEELELNTDEQKQAFIDIFLKEVVHIPLVQKIYFDEIKYNPSIKNYIEILIGNPTRIKYRANACDTTPNCHR